MTNKKYFTKVFIDKDYLYVCLGAHCILLHVNIISWFQKKDECSSEFLNVHAHFSISDLCLKNNYVL